MKQIIQLIALFIATSATSHPQPPSPLDQIDITASTLTCEKKDPELVITYKDNVVIKCADGSTLTSDTFELCLKELPGKEKPGEKKKEMGVDMFKTARCSGNVNLVSANRSAHADTVDVDIATRECTLRGNVSIKQIKEKDDDIPLTTTCNEAFINLETKSVTLSGQTETPVSTSISLAGHPALAKLNKGAKKS